MKTIPITGLRVYVAGPITIGDPTLNIRNAIVAGNQLRTAGHAPYIPHLTHFWGMITPRAYEDWLLLDEHYLALCEALVRIPGESKGADREVDFAYEHNIPVYYSVLQFLMITDK